jgi:hypothetical protein
MGAQHMDNIREYDPGLMLFGNTVYFHMAIDELKLFLVTVADFLQKSIKRQTGKFDRSGIEMSTYFEEPLPEILFTAVITASVSLLERELQSISKVLQKAIDFPLAISDLAGSWIEKFPKYCKTAAGIDVRRNKSLWQDISDAVAIRNCLVHADGYLTDTNVQSRKAVSFLKRHGLQSSSRERIVSNQDLARTLLDSVTVFIDSTYQQTLQKYPYESSENQ